MTGLGLREAWVSGGIDGLCYSPTGILFEDEQFTQILQRMRQIGTFDRNALRNAATDDVGIEFSDIRSETIGG